MSPVGRGAAAQVRTIVEALAKRCGYDAVAAGIPESDAKLLVHIRKQKERKARQREERRGEEDGGDVDMDARSRCVCGRTSEGSRCRYWRYHTIGLRASLAHCLTQSPV